MSGPATGLPPRRLRAVLFDLDGTLVDTAPDITVAMNCALSAFRLRALSLQEIIERIGQGPRVLVQRVLAVQEALRDDAARDRLVEPLLASYLHHYSEAIGLHGRLFPRVTHTLRELRAWGLKVGVVTNAAQQPALTIIDRYGIAALIDVVLGGDRVRQRKPHPELLEAACAQLGVRPEEVLMVGDSIHDVDAARAAGCDMVCVRHGYNEGRPVEHLDCELIQGFTSLAGRIAAGERCASVPCSAR